LLTIRERTAQVSFALDVAGRIRHSWSARQPDKSFVITCPNKDKPGVKETADVKIAELRAKRKNRKDRDDKRKKPKTTSNTASSDSTSVVVTSPNGRVVFVAQVLVNASEMRQPSQSR